MVTLNNRIAEHVGEGRPEVSDTPTTPPLVELRYRVRGMCDFHIARVRKGVYQVRVGRSADALVNFRHHPDMMDDSGYGKARRRLRAALGAGTGKVVRFELDDLACSTDATWIAERVGVAINTWRLATGRADFPPLEVVARAVALPEPMAKVAIRDYRKAEVEA